MSMFVHGSAVNLSVTSNCDRIDLEITVATRRVAALDNLKNDLYSAYKSLVASMLGPDQELEPAPLPAA